VRRLTGNEHLSFEFAAEWPTYDLDEKTRTLLAYAAKLTDTPSLIDDADIDALRAAGWDEHGIWQATALISFFNCTGRMEAAAGLPPDQVPSSSQIPEMKKDGRSGAGLLKRPGETPSAPG
jgi:alkylhydroperoxidase family enzyme